MREVKVWAMGKGMGFRKLEDKKRDMRKESLTG